MRATDVIPPLTPDREQAREWAERELDRAVYRAAEPTPLDRIAQAVRDFVAGLFGAQAPPGLGALVLVIAAVLVVAAIVIAFIVWGRPRAPRHSAARTGGLFAVDDDRSAADLRRAADLAAERADWDEAVILRFRALARGLVERGAVDLGPGATAQTLTEAISSSFPALARQARDAATTFDDVRYLRRRGDRAQFERVVGADTALNAASPAAGVLR